MTHDATRDAADPSSPLRTGLKRAAAALGTLACVSLGFYFLMPGEGPALLPEPGVDAAMAQTLPRPTPAAQLAVAPADAESSDAASNDRLLRAPYETTLTVAPGDTLMAMLTGVGLDRPQAHRAIRAMAEVFSPRKLKPGQNLTLTLAPAGPDSPARLQALSFSPAVAREIRVARTDDPGSATDGASAEGAAFAAEAIDTPLERRLARAEGRIDSSLYNAALDAGVPMPVLSDLITVFSFDIDFQREIQPGDRFALLYEEKADDTGQAVDHGEVLMAEMTVGDKQRRYYRFEDGDGFVDYFDAKGRSVRKALLRTPVDGARISSRFGKRKHPVLGYTKMHKGMDFAAPTGTPIYAAGDGIVEAAGWNGGYGKYVRIRHNGTYKTAYAHMTRIDGRVKRGQRVRQRQIIGYVGTTGRSTGPHLHYEVHKHGRQVNPLGVKLPTGKTLAGADLQRFQKRRQELESRYASLEGSLDGTDTASAASSCSATAPATATC